MSGLSNSAQLHPPSPEPFFISTRGSDGGQRFCILHRPEAAVGDRVRGTVVYVHPFAEEMNKSRRMAALQSRALAQDGYAVLQIDLGGCGDSSGDFGDATWIGWIGDVTAAADFMQDRYPRAPLWLWGLRAGCLLATQAALLRSAPHRFLFWQPATSGKILLQQFFRLKLAGDLLDGKRKSVVAEDLRQQLSSGAIVEVAGYGLSPALAHGLEAALLEPPPGAARLEWIDVASRADAVAPAAERALKCWRDAGCDVGRLSVVGPAFWQTAELETIPALIAAGRQALARGTLEGVAA